MHPDRALPDHLQHGRQHLGGSADHIRRVHLAIHHADDRTALLPEALERFHESGMSLDHQIFIKQSALGLNEELVDSVESDGELGQHQRRGQGTLLLLRGRRLPIQIHSLRICKSSYSSPVNDRPVGFRSPRVGGGRRWTSWSCCLTNVLTTYYTVTLDDLR